jgi:hypothetical protein
MNTVPTYGDLQSQDYWVGPNRGPRAVSAAANRLDKLFARGMGKTVIAALHNLQEGPVESWHYEDGQILAPPVSGLVKIVTAERITYKNDAPGRYYDGMWRRLTYATDPLFDEGLVMDGPHTYEIEEGNVNDLIRLTPRYYLPSYSGQQLGGVLADADPGTFAPRTYHFLAPQWIGDVAVHESEMQRTETRIAQAEVILPALNA